MWRKRLKAVHFDLSPPTRRINRASQAKYEKIDQVRKFCSVLLEVELILKAKFQAYKAKSKFKKFEPPIFFKV